MPKREPSLARPKSARHDRRAMTAPKNRQIQLTRIPDAGMPLDSDFKLAETPAGKPAAGEVLLRTIYLSMDPYQRNWMAGIVAYGYRAEPGLPVVGRAVSEVLESQDPRFKPGDFVYGETGWQTHPTVKGDAIQKIDASLGPISTSVGVLGSPGLTAYVGMVDVGQPKAGDTVIVSAAAGAVGSVAGQIAKIKGARVIGVAGSTDKCRYVVEELGYDACLSHRSKDLPGEIARACPDGINVYFDNTGGPITDAVYAQLKPGAYARIALCGLVAEYNTPDARGPNLKYVLYSQSTIKAFSVRDNLHRMGDYRREASAWMKAGQLKFREDIVQGIENTLTAFRGMLEGKNFGKLLVQVGNDPTRN
jgi:NADPH-dependent curcumin reductase